MGKKVLFIPLVLFLLLAAAFLWQLNRNAHGDDPTLLESALLGKSVPTFRVQSLQDPNQYVTQTALITGKPLLVNVWATWCPTCRAEHDYLNTLAEKGIPIVGIDYKDDRTKAVNWLNTLGDPYMLNLWDGDGMLGLNFGIYGTPETFLVDAKGIIRYRHPGNVDAQVWTQQIQPLWEKYSKLAEK
ncbi:DsbE family thiol:disulfide interchange protein [Tatumella saanichensis]|uniref:DsbE family thiol:disulfide interchange protein n=1 Tax=Tatumella saanichensis TaxID=480813 RepID=UPI0004A481C4|nr:DsbE family thiol:disulfide interchange protein [Tatumella saanichensis]